MSESDAVPEHAVDAAPGRPPVVDFARTIRRLRRSLSIIAVLVLLGWTIVGALGAGWSVALLAELAGFGLFAAFAVEVVIVGGSAARGMLAAGEQGERLAGSDVSLLPPQLAGRRRPPPRDLVEEKSAP
ncbi:MAG: hypothetical protein WEB03_11710 [Nitriliruptor sp.]|uniref:hypothetical protein n=1 Tax=Nitriliruptor sp. TaxID=2448056 RepID=UPI0034A001BD